VRVYALVIIIYTHDEDEDRFGTVRFVDLGIWVSLSRELLGSSLSCPCAGAVNSLRDKMINIDRIMISSSGSSSHNIFKWFFSTRQTKYDHYIVNFIIFLKEFVVFYLILTKLAKYGKLFY